MLHDTFPLGPPYCLCDTLQLRAGICAANSTALAEQYLRSSASDCRAGRRGASAATPMARPRSRCVSRDRLASCITSAASGEGGGAQVGICSRRRPDVTSTTSAGGCSLLGRGGDVLLPPGPILGTASSMSVSDCSAVSRGSMPASRVRWATSRGWWSSLICRSVSCVRPLSQLPSCGSSTTLQQDRQTLMNVMMSLIVAAAFSTAGTSLTLSGCICLSCSLGCRPQAMHPVCCAGLCCLKGQVVDKAKPRALSLQVGWHRRGRQVK
jgi:hypothetical protein